MNAETRAAIKAEFDEIFEPATGTRPVMSKPPKVMASRKLIRMVAAEISELGGVEVVSADAYEKLADWLADKMERFGQRTAQPVFTMDGTGPCCSWCGAIWPLCGCHHNTDWCDDDSTTTQQEEQQ